ncbi:MAG: hypothetical protein QM692_16335 [Thermomicrobiales bacterium]
MRKLLITTALAGMLLTGGALTASAQNGVVIQNNGVDSSQSAAGADNVNVSRADGNSATNNGGGVNNEVRTVDRDRSRDRKDRSERTSDEVSEAAPAGEGEWVPEDSYETYADDGTWTEPVEAPVELAAEVQPAPGDTEVAPLQLPNTGAGIEDTLPLAAFASGMLAAGFGTESLRRRLWR